MGNDQTDTRALAVPEDKSKPCNICGRGWPYHYERCSYLVTAAERAELAVEVERLRAALRAAHHHLTHPAEAGLQGKVNALTVVSAALGDGAQQ